MSNGHSHQCGCCGMIINVNYFPLKYNLLAFQCSSYRITVYDFFFLVRQSWDAMVDLFIRFYLMTSWVYKKVKKFVVSSILTTRLLYRHRLYLYWSYFILQWISCSLLLILCLFNAYGVDDSCTNNYLFYIYYSMTMDSWNMKATGSYSWVSAEG